MKCTCKNGMKKYWLSIDLKIIEEEILRDMAINKGDENECRKIIAKAKGG